MRNALIAAVVAAVVASGSAGAASGWPHRQHRHHTPTPTAYWVTDLPVIAGAEVTDTAACPTGTVVTGGGAETGGADVRASFPVGDPLKPTGWTATVVNDTDHAVSVKVYALCITS